MTASNIPNSAALLRYPIGENTLRAVEIVSPGRIEAFWQYGPYDIFPIDGLDFDDLDPGAREDLLFAYGYLRGLADAWNATALEVWEAWLDAALPMLVRLVDDGTLDTVVELFDHRVRFADTSDLRDERDGQLNWTAFLDRHLTDICDEVFSIT